jgi:cytochrome b
MNSGSQKNPQRGGLDILESEERRHQPEPIIRVWDVVVRSGHWLLVALFAILYFKSGKFPLHAYAGLAIMGIVVIRIVWGFVGGRAARFSSFLFSPAAAFRYFRQALGGHAPYHASHNPMGAWMVYLLLLLLLVNGVLGMMYYSTSQQLGPLGDSVPVEWDEMLEKIHFVLGHATAGLVLLHMLGVVWAARAHRENYVTAMFTGFKRVPRNAERSALDGYSIHSEAVVPRPLAATERWFNTRRPAIGSLLIVLAVVLAVFALSQVAILFNDDLPVF